MQIKLKEREKELKKKNIPSRTLTHPGHTPRIYYCYVQREHLMLFINKSSKSWIKVESCPSFSYFTLMKKVFKNRLTENNIFCVCFSSLMKFKKKKVSDHVYYTHGLSSNYFCSIYC